MKKVFIIGGTSIDSIVHLNSLPEPKPQTIFGGTINETIGSTGAGKAMNLSKLGISSVFHSLIGNDEYGFRVINTLKEHGVRFYYDFDPNGTERHVNLMDKLGNRISIFVNASSGNLTLDIDKIEPLIKDADIIVLNIMNYTKQLIPLIKKYNKTVWTDLHDYNVGNPYYEEFIDIADYIFMSSDNLSDYTSLMKDLINKGKKLVVCTHGKNGATALSENQEWLNIPVIDDYALVDANGAGDSFFSGYLYGFIMNKAIDECMKLGTICAGLCITSNELVHNELSEHLLNTEYKKYYDK